jgi:hypothetical protein
MHKTNHQAVPSLAAPLMAECVYRAAARDYCREAGVPVRCWERAAPALQHKALTLLAGYMGADLGVEDEEDFHRAVSGLKDTIAWMHAKAPAVLSHADAVGAAIGGAASSWITSEAVRLEAEDDERRHREARDEAGALY